MVLDRMFLIERAGQTLPADFGVRLTTQAVDEVLSMQRLQQASYRQMAAQDVKTLRRLVDSTAHALLSGASPR